MAAQGAAAETLALAPGRFFGPGNTGIHSIGRAEVRNIVLTGPLSGEVPFFNNGPAAPNVIAEVLLGGEVDGRTSTGVLINENIDTGLFLELRDPVTRQVGRLMVVAIAAEQMRPDAKGNLTFNPSVIADPGIPELARPFSVVFTTGAKEIPLSLRTQRGQPGGHDQAGPLPSGRFVIGRIGDFDQDGRLDGILVQAENSPLDLVIANGDPIAQRRPWSLDVPIHPLQAAGLALNGIVQNFPEPIAKAIVTRDREALAQYLDDLRERLPAIRENLRRGLAGLSGQDESLVRRARARLAAAERLLGHGKDAGVVEPEPAHGGDDEALGAGRIFGSLQLVGDALGLLARVGH
jgi:hypothetical protein